MTTIPVCGGGCFCGAIRFEVSGPELYACFCHCESCRRVTGGAFVPWVTFTRPEFRVTRGNISWHHSTPGVTRGFCPACGTSLSYEHERRPGQIDVTMTSLDEPDAIRPRSHIWVEDKLSWITIADDLPQFEKTAG